MSAMRVNPDALEELARRFLQAAAQMQGISERVAHLVSSLDWQVRAQPGVEEKIAQAAAGGRNLAAEAERIGQAMQSCAQRFREAEARSEADMKDMACRMAATPTATYAAAAAAFAAGCVSKTDWLQRSLNAKYATTEQKDQSFRNEYWPSQDGKKNYYKGTEECKGFAETYYERVYGIKRADFPGLSSYVVTIKKDGKDVEVPIYTYKLSLGENSPIQQVAQISSDTLDKAIDAAPDAEGAGRHVQEILAQAQKGDFLQSYMPGTNTPHSAIVSEVVTKMNPKTGLAEITGVKVYDANWGSASEHNIIQERPITITDLVEMLKPANAGLTIYRANDK